MASSLFGLLPFSSQAGLPDRLEQPASHSDAAKSVMLLDIARSGENLVAVGDLGVILISVNEGRDWQQVSSPVSTLLTAVFFQEDQGWVTGHDGVLLTSKDAGLTWEKVLDGHTINALLVEDAQSKLESLQADAYADAMDIEDAEFDLEDAEVAMEEGPVNPLLDVLFTSSQTGVVVGAYGLALSTVDGGQTWTSFADRLPNPDRLHLNALLQADDQLYIAGEAGLLLKSYDQGQSWQSLPSPYDGSFFALAQHQDELLALGLRGNLFRSLDAGYEWHPVHVEPTVSFLGAQSHSGLLAITGLGGTLLLGPDSNQLLTQPLNTRRHFNSVIATEQGWILVGEQGVFLSNRAKELAQ
ncbi:YCF48-related protein [Nitrincola alkalisediminis]